MNNITLRNIIAITCVFAFFAMAICQTFEFIDLSWWLITAPLWGIISAVWLVVFCVSLWMSTVIVLKAAIAEFKRGGR